MSGMGRLRFAKRSAMRDSWTGVLVQGPPERRGHGLTREVVVGRAEAAGEHDEVGALQRRPHGELEVRELVTDDAAGHDVDAERGETLGDHAGVRVGATERQQLAADRDRLGARERCGPHASRSTRVPARPAGARTRARRRPP